MNLKISLKPIIFLSLICVISCSRIEDTSSASESRLKEMMKLWNDYKQSGQYESLIDSSSSFLSESIADNDTFAVLYSCVNMAQASLLSEKLDSLDVYFSLIDRFHSSSCSDNHLNGMIYCLKGGYALKSELNYSKAFNFFYKAYEAARSGDDPNNQIINLSNIVSIFYMRGDRNGLEFAEQALEVARTGKNLDPYIGLLAYMSTAQMLFLSERFDEAQQYLELIEKSLPETFTSVSSLVFLLKADLSKHYNRLSDAEKYYFQALQLADISDPATLALTYMKIGDLYRKSGKNDLASEYYIHGLDVTYKYSSNEFRQNFLEKLTDIHRESGDVTASSKYFLKYLAYADTILFDNREKEFNELLLSYKGVKFENEIQKKQLEVLKSKRRSMALTFAFIIVSIVSVALFVNFRKQRKMNMKLVSQYQNYVKRLNLPLDPPSESEKCRDSDLPDAKFKDIFNRLEHLMRDEQVFRNKDISIENVSSLLKTNRTYLSKAVNLYSGMSFQRYVNMYRINEATKIISDPGNKIPLKQVADELGYSSVEMFYKAFQRETGCTTSQYKRSLPVTDDN